MITKLCGKWVVGHQDGAHCLFEDGEVVFEDGKVIFVGYDYDGHVDKVEELGNVLIGPGFIDLDAIVDLDSTVLGFDNHPGWKKGRVPSAQWARRETYSPAQLAFNKRYAFNMLLLNGITTAMPITSILYREWAETYDEFIVAADIAEETGIRAYLGPAYMSGHAVVNPDKSISMRFDEAKGMAGLSDAIRYVERVRSDYSSRIDGFLAPDRIEGCTPELLKRTAEAQQRLACPVRLHSCQGELEVEMITKLHGGISSIEYIHRAGLISDGLILPHLQFLGGAAPTEASIKQDLSLISQGGASALICPIVAGRHGKYFDGVSTFKEWGINLSLGTDTYPVDMIQNMHIGCILSRVSKGDIAEASALDYYNMATLGGARALGRDDLGRLCAGAAADIIVFDFDSVYTGQNFDPITAMVINGNGRDIKGVIVDGVKRVWDGQLVSGVSMQELHRQAQAQFSEFKASYPERCYGSPTLEDVFPLSLNKVSKQLP
ncbi:chlorohydrolase family protein [Aliagarivorans taiwanensis]|uniref:chlorohydrolase family protein n=1 Tax=Aliagarivorans taiwanensis TaxID=561966 RepID=UPI0004212955|nr:chlorohydrolase family protein [Aliagarivorans taiwanensis]